MTPAMIPNQYQAMLRLQNGMAVPQNELPRKAMQNSRNAYVEHLSFSFSLSLSLSLSLVHSVWVCVFSLSLSRSLCVCVRVFGCPHIPPKGKRWVVTIPNTRPLGGRGEKGNLRTIT